MAQKRHIVYRTMHLKDRISWTSGVAGVIRMLTWETENALGISKTRLQQRVLDHVFESCANEVLDQPKWEAITSALESKIENEIDSASVENLYDEPIKGRLISPIEAQRRLRFFSEEFLNKEFDVFTSLLPSSVLTYYLKGHFTIRPESQWTITGSSNDFEASTGMKFMYMDTLAYAHNTSTLVALELKMDSPLGKDQILKYCFMAAYLESKGFIAPNSNFHILIIGNKSLTPETLSTMRQTAAVQLNEKQYPKKKITREQIELFVPRVASLINTMEVKSTNWQEFGDYFHKLNHTLPTSPYAETLHKLIDGFLVSLQTKYSRKLKRPIYVR